MAAGVLVAVEKPWALLHPQLWAEDSTVHLLENETMGAAAIFHPYRGYLHFLPRVIAWLASHTVDVASWPTFYNFAALAVAVIVFARMASPRLDLPQKPWLILSFVLAVSTGEVFLNITNLHWLTSFLILMQVLMRAPTKLWQWAGDFLVLPIVGLTGPFVAVLLPLFAWRLWRERTLYSLLLFLVAGACAAIQAYLVVTTGPKYFTKAESVHVEMLLAVAGSRYAVWPLLGPHVALGLPLWALGLLGGTIVALLAASALRPGPHRLLRLQVLAAFVLLAATGLYRIRPDGWQDANLELGDSYFYIPRILAMWLLIWNFSVRPRALAWTARGLFVLGVLLNLTDMVQPAPVDFNWRTEAQAIRAGTPANLPTLPEGWIFQYPGRDAHAEPTAGWYEVESGKRGVWRWTAGGAVLHVVSRYLQPVHVVVTMKGMTAQTVSVSQNGKVVWTGNVDEQFREYSIPVQVPESGSTDVVFSSDQSGVRESVDPHARVLAFAIYNWSVRND